MSRINDQKQERIQELDCQQVQMKQSFQSKMVPVQERIQKLVVADKEKEKMLEDQLTAIQVLETKVASMSETNIMNQMSKLKVKMNTCIEENHAIQKENEISIVKIQQLKVENAQLQENLQQEVQNGSKALVSGNSNAKALHLNSLKMELTKLRHEKVQLEGSIREHEKATEKNLNST